MKNKNQPLVSIIMPVYNAGHFLAEAIASLQNQTHQNWELIAVDDHSIDNSWKILKEFAQNDTRIKISRTRKNRGVAYTTNLALSKTKGEFIARMDADDISLPWRLQKQVDFLQKNPQVIAIGGQCELIDRNGTVIGGKRFPTDFKKIKEMIFVSIPLQQPTLMVNRQLLPKDFSWYEDSFDVAEEVELLFKLFQYGQVRNLPATILQYRLHNQNLSLQNPKRTFFLTFKTRIKAIFQYHYQPTIKGLIATLGQLMVVSLLPNQLIFPLYSFFRGLKRVGIKSFKIATRPLLFR